MLKCNFNKVANGPKSGPNFFFAIFASLLAVKHMKKIGEPKFGPNGSKLGPKSSFSPFS